jgi:hypothetical protein
MPKSTQTAQKDQTNPSPDKAKPSEPYRGDGNDNVCMEYLLQMFERKEAMEREEVAKQK